MERISQMLAMQGRVAAITGGGGHLGAAMAEALAELGADLLLIDKDAAQATTVQRAIESEFGVKVVVAEYDLERLESLAELQPLVEKEFGRLDILINNAAFVGDSNLTGWACDFSQQSLSAWQRAMTVNLSSCFTLCQLFTDLLKQSGQGSIINIGSIYGVVGPDWDLYAGTEMGNPAAYAASKGGLIQLSRWLSTALAPEVRVNAISPGGIARNQPASFQEKYCSQTPLGRLGTETDIKGAVAYLATNLSRYVTGQNLLVDGGWTAR